MKKMFYVIYKILGRCVCSFLGMYWDLRDKVVPPKGKNVLFVAHPDDDTLFFHTFIKSQKPYVCLMTTGWSLRRLPCFMKAMKYYGVRYRVFGLESKDQREELIRKNVRKVLSLGEFETIVTHNSQGEYGHEMHCRLHKCILDVTSKTLYCPVTKDKICSYPLKTELVQEKKKIFNNIYYTEKFVLEQYTEWVVHEKLERIDV